MIKLSEDYYLTTLEKRTISVQIGRTLWKPEMLHTGIIIESFNEIEQVEDFELRALKYFCYIAQTQLFIDWNKRVAQLMMNKVFIEYYEAGSDTKNYYIYEGMLY